jgi:hypothetical protein
LPSPPLFWVCMYFEPHLGFPYPYLLVCLSTGCIARSPHLVFTIERRVSFIIHSHRLRACIDWYPPIDRDVSSL